MSANHAVRTPRTSLRLLQRNDIADLHRLKLIRQERQAVLAYHRERYLDAAWAVFDVEAGVANAKELLACLDEAER
jgi:hypothetical protein